MHEIEKIIKDNKQIITISKLREKFINLLTEELKQMQEEEFINFLKTFNFINRLSLKL